MPKRRVRAVLATFAIVALLTAAGAAWGDRRAQVHEASALILLNPLVGSPFSPENTRDSLVNLETEAQLVRSDAVARMVASDTTSDASVSELLRDLSVEVPPNTQLLKLTYRARADATAVQRAQAFARAYLRYREERSRAELADRNAQIQEQIRERTERRGKATIELGKVPPQGSAAVLLQQELIEITSQIGQLRTQSAALQTESSDPGQMVTPAAPQGAPPLGWTVLGSLAGLTVGAGLSVALGATRRHRHPTLGDDVALQHLLTERGVPFLGSSDAVDEVRGNLLAAPFAQPATLLVAGLGQVDGALDRGRALADSLVRAERRALVVDLSTDGADLPREFAQEDTVLDDLIASPRMGLLLLQLQKRADVVLLLVGPAHGVRARVLASRADRILLECDSEVTPTQLTTALQDAERSGTPIAGVVRVVRHIATRRRPRRVRRAQRARRARRAARATRVAAPALPVARP
jgi:polysaccharide biosynthesis transport protein